MKRREVIKKTAVAAAATVCAPIWWAAIPKGKKLPPDPFEGRECAPIPKVGEVGTLCVLVKRDEVGDDAKRAETEARKTLRKLWPEEYVRVERLVSTDKDVVYVHPGEEIGATKYWLGEKDHTGMIPHEIFLFSFEARRLR